MTVLFSPVVPVKWRLTSAWNQWEGAIHCLDPAQKTKPHRSIIYHFKSKGIVTRARARTHKHTQTHTHTHTHTHPTTHYTQNTPTTPCTRLTAHLEGMWLLILAGSLGLGRGLDPSIRGGNVGLHELHQAVVGSRTLRLLETHHREVVWQDAHLHIKLWHHNYHLRYVRGSTRKKAKKQQKKHSNNTKVFISISRWHDAHLHTKQRNRYHLRLVRWYTRKNKNKKTIKQKVFTSSAADAHLRITEQNPVTTWDQSDGTHTHKKHRESNNKKSFSSPANTLWYIYFFTLTIMCTVKQTCPVDIFSFLSAR